MSENSNGVYGVELADAAQKVNAAAVTVAEVASNAVSGAAPEVQVAAEGAFSAASEGGHFICIKITFLLLWVINNGVNVLVGLLNNTRV